MAIVVQKNGNGVQQDWDIDRSGDSSGPLLPSSVNFSMTGQLGTTPLAKLGVLVDHSRKPPIATSVAAYTAYFKVLCTPRGTETSCQEHQHNLPQASLFVLRHLLHRPQFPSPPSNCKLVHLRHLSSFPTTRVADICQTILDRKMAENRPPPPTQRRVFASNRPPPPPTQWV